jgi:hemerythrin superfamily protein
VVEELVEPGPALRAELNDVATDYLFTLNQESAMPSRKSPRNSASKSRRDAISLLKADHRQVKGWFSSFDKTQSEARKQQLASKICSALKVHTRIEEEIFYPAFLEQAQEEDMHHEAVVEHDAAKKLIAEIEAATPSEEYYDAKVTVLSEMIKHHVKEEEQPGGMFAKARKSDMDLAELGQRLAARKKQLMNSSGPSSTRRARNVHGSGRAEGRV